jgi:hypothetical protein
MIRQSKPFSMKKVIFVFSSVILGLITAQAQTTTFGFKAGVSANNLPLRTETSDDDNVRIDGGHTGFHVGGVADIAFNQKFSIQPNLLFALKGGSFVTTGRVQIMSIDLPINFLYKHNGFFVGLGPNLSYGISAKLKPYDTGDPDTDLYEEQPLDEEPLFNRFEVGVNALMGYQFPSGLTIGTTFNRGFSNILNDEDLIGTNTQINTRFFGFSVGYMFGKTTAKKK